MYNHSVSLKQVTYKIHPITVNGIQVTEVIIDMHYKEKHGDHISDELILRLVKELDGRRELPDAVTEKYSYFATLVELGKKQYRLIWLLEEKSIYIGVVNAYRDNRRK